MPAFPIVTLPDPVLRTPGEPIGEIGDTERQLAAGLIETLNANTLLGMAAIMVGIPKRMAILAVDASGGITNPRVLINPALVSVSPDLEKGPEGCPSVPGIFEDVERSRKIVASYRDLDGVERTIAAEGLQARVIQHQIDLCDGILFIDRLSRLKRSRIEKKLSKAMRRR